MEPLPDPILYVRLLGLTWRFSSSAGKIAAIDWRRPIAWPAPVPGGRGLMSPSSKMPPTAAMVLIGCSGSCFSIAAPTRGQVP